MRRFPVHDEGREISKVSFTRPIRPSCLSSSGEVASKTAVEYINEKLCSISSLPVDAELVKIYLVNLVLDANKVVYEKSLECDDHSGMGTTIIVSLINESKIHIGHVGDSRAYIIRNGNIDKITEDHSYIEELLRNGSINAQEAKVHPNKNLITRALGCADDLEVDYYCVEIIAGDILLLCTDGLTNMVDEEKIFSACITLDDPQQIADDLVRLANDNGWEDNISVIVVKVN